jgi:hypothetical protein
MGKQQIIAVIFVLLTLYGCMDRGGEKYNFYATSGGWDWICIPLIEPYLLLKVDPEIETHDWALVAVKSGEEPFGNHISYNVKRVDVKDSLIFLYSEGERAFISFDNTHINFSSVFCVIDVARKDLIYFHTEDSLKEYIKAKNHPSPDWHNVDSLSHAVSAASYADKSDHLILPWYPKKR